MAVREPPEQDVRWEVRARDHAAEARLREALGAGPLLAAVLAGRGISAPEDAARFLDPRLEDLHDPRLLPDFGPAMRRLLAAREAKERIFVHGDYDVDGVTSAALLTRFLQALGCDVTPHVPHRLREGYGIHESAVEMARATGAKVMLTCDCGVAAFQQVEAAREAGMDVVVTDHHQVGETLPGAVAVVNPHRRDSAYPFEDLSGVGVAFKLCLGLVEELGLMREQFFRAYLDLAALGTVADVMPLVDENRIIVAHGLPLIPRTRKVGLAELYRVAMANGKDEPLRAWHIGFRLGPRINAAGRIDDAALALDLLLQKDPAEARRIALELEAINKERREEQERIFEEAVDQVEDTDQASRPAILVAGIGWHPGVIGIVAGKLVERFRRPAFVVSSDPDRGVGHGSARSIPAFNLYDAIREHMHLLVRGGGHALAAGFTAKLDNLGALRKALDGYAARILRDEDFTLVRRVDAEVTLAEADHAATEELGRLEPTGQANPEPRFVCRNVRFEAILPTSKPAHCRALLGDGTGASRSAVAFWIGERLAAIPQGSTGDVLFRPQIETFNGRQSLKWIIEDFTVNG
jgi:single-stranded-DNA-specific exonuclease